jgi:hypothetical protein
VDLTSAQNIDELCFENCINLGNVRALKLRKCEPDAFLDTRCKIQTEFEGFLADVERVA